MSNQELKTPEDYLRSYPRISAHIIAESLGYAVPLLAARILKDAKEGQENCCEWIHACHNKDPRPAVQGAIKNRHSHKGYMASYDLALRIVRHQLDAGESPLLASWF